MKKIKIAFFISHPIQYFAPLFRYLNKNESIDLTVCYFSDETLKSFKDKQFDSVIKWDVDLTGGYKYKIIPNIIPGGTINKKFLGLVNPGVIKEIKYGNYDVIIVHGWAYISDWIVFLTAFSLGVPVLLRGEMPLKQEFFKNRLKLFFKKIVLKSLFKKIYAFLYIGEQNRLFYRYYGADINRLYFAPYAVDNDFFHSRYLKLKIRKNELKKKYGVENYKKIILFVGKLIDKKRPMDLVKAFKKLNNDDVCLIMVGNGYLKKDIEEYIKKYKLDNIKLTGFVNQSELPEIYTIADVFVLPSGVGETWGLVVNEAMNYALPVLVSDTVGCSDDLIKNNGFTFKEGDVCDLKNKLEILINDKNLEKKGLKSLEIIKHYSYKNIENAIMKAIKDIKSEK